MIDGEGRNPLPSFVILRERYEGRRAGDVTVSTAEFALVISVLSLIFLGYSTIRGNKRSDHTDVERRAAETATINVKLDPVSYTHLDVYKRQVYAGREAGHDGHHSPGGGPFRRIWNLLRGHSGESGLPAVFEGIK